MVVYERLGAALPRTSAWMITCDGCARAILSAITPRINMILQDKCGSCSTSLELYLENCKGH